MPAGLLRSLQLNLNRMLSTRPSECLAGDEGLARGAWAEAREVFEEALGVREFPEALEGLGNAAWWLDLADLRNGRQGDPGG